MRILSLFLLVVTPFVTADIAFRIPDPDLIPEGIAYDARTRTFFVSSTFKRKIVAINQAGEVRDFVPEARDGIFGVLGMRVDDSRRILWAISSNAGATMPARGLDKSCLGCSIVTGYDVDSGKLLRKYELSNTPSVHFLNDLVVAPSGDVYITDTISGDIYRISREQDRLERWSTVGDKTFPNGIDISADGRTLFVATGAGLKRVNIADGTVTTVTGFETDKPPVIDGLYFYKQSLIAIQPFEAERTVVRYHLDPAGSHVTRTDVIEPNSPQFAQPTTGTIVGDDFYFIANAQLQIFRAMYKEGAYDRSALRDVVVMKSRLAPAAPPLAVTSSPARAPAFGCAGRAREGSIHWEEAQATRPGTNAR